MQRSNAAAGDELRSKPRGREVTSPAASEPTGHGQAAPSSTCTTTTPWRTVVFFAALVLLFAGAMFGRPVGVRTFSYARDETRPVDSEIANGAADSGPGVAASAAAGAVPKKSKTGGGSSTAVMGSAENRNRDNRNGSGSWKFTAAGGNLSATAKEGTLTEACPACESMFGQLDEKKQHVSLQLRGEPKSGTSFMYEWALNALMVTCSRLNVLYGRHSCHVTWRGMLSWKKEVSPVSADKKSTEMKEVKLSFEPKRERKHIWNSAAGSHAACPCENVVKVSVAISSLFKHDLPVSKTCSWQHIDNVTPEGGGCTTVAGRPVQNHTDTADCLHQNPCEITDSRLQMLILRDPRAVAVSSFFHLKMHPPSFGGHRLRDESVDAYALRLLPTICHFVHLRWLLLQERMADKTVEFEYDESLADPFGWHDRWLAAVGLTPPKSVVQEATDTALRGEYGFAGKGVDEHPGGKEVTPARSWEDEISAAVVEQLNDICRVWLPPVLLEKFGIDAQPK